MNKLLLVDCDGTIRQTKSGEKFINKPTDQEPITGAVEALNHYHSEGWLIVGVTNQAGVAAGHKSLENCVEEQQYTLRLFPQLEAIYFCPDYEGQLCYRVNRYKYEQRHLWRDDINFRKPGDGMIFRAFIDFYGGHPDEAWMVGDRPEDEEAATTAEINFMWADIWRSRFLPGVHEFNNLSLEQVKFLEGLK